MSEKRINLTVRVMVSMQCTVSDDSGDIEVISVQRVSPPSAQEVMEAIDGGGEFQQLDEAFAAA